MTDLIDIEREFGELSLGAETESKQPSKYGKFSRYQLNPINRNWYNLAKFINFGKSKM